jgi:hypothetical protein
VRFFWHAADAARPEVHRCEQVYRLCDAARPLLEAKGTPRGRPRNVSGIEGSVLVSSARTLGKSTIFKILAGRRRRPEEVSVPGASPRFWTGSAFHRKKAAGETCCGG